jgi:hypothetical protein
MYIGANQIPTHYSTLHLLLSNSRYSLGQLKSLNGLYLNNNNLTGQIIPDNIRSIEEPLFFNFE